MPAWYLVPQVATLILGRQMTTPWATQNQQESGVDVTTLPSLGKLGAAQGSAMRSTSPNLCYLRNETASPCRPQMEQWCHSWALGGSSPLLWHRTQYPPGLPCGTGCGQDPAMTASWDRTWSGHSYDWPVE